MCVCVCVGGKGVTDRPTDRSTDQPCLWRRRSAWFSSGTPRRRTRGAPTSRVESSRSPLPSIFLFFFFLVFLVFPVFLVRSAFSLDHRRPLTRRGRDLADALGTRLARALPRPPDLIITSDAARAMQVLVLLAYIVRLHTSNRGAADSCSSCPQTWHSLRPHLFPPAASAAAFDFVISPELYPLAIDEEESADETHSAEKVGVCSCGDE